MIVQDLAILFLFATFTIYLIVATLRLKKIIYMAKRDQKHIQALSENLTRLIGLQSEFAKNTNTLSSKILLEVKKGNKDRQEVKTKLTNLRQLVERNHKELKKRGGKNGK